MKSIYSSPELTWRDIMYITVLGSRPHAIPSNVDFIRNAAGYNGKTLFTILSSFLNYSIFFFQLVVNLVLV